MLIACEECSKEYSDQAKTCIHCGARNPSKKTAGAKFGVFLLWAAGIFVALVVFGNLVYDPDKDAAQRAIAECRKSKDDALLGRDARLLARKACDRMVADYRRQYGHSP